VDDLRPLESRARWAVIALVAVVVVDVFAIPADWLEIDLMNRLLDGENVPTGDLDASDSRKAAVGLGYFVAEVAAAILFIRWFHAAYRNVRELGARELRFGPGWAIGGWFVPILSLWRPKQIANDIWRGSDPAEPPEQELEWKEKPVPQLYGWWWAGWIASVFIGNLALRSLFDEDTPGAIRDAALLDLVVSLVDLAAAILAILVVRRTTERQAERARRVDEQLAAGW
jgi:hypothetical protein